MGVKVKEKVKGSGEWWIFINHSSKRKSKKIGKDKRLAREVAKKIEAKLTLGDMDIGEKRKTPTLKNTFTGGMTKMEHFKTPRYGLNRDRPISWRF